MANTGKLPFRVIPDMRQLGYANEQPGRMTPGYMLSTTRIAASERRIDAIETINPAFRLTELENKIPAIEQRLTVVETNGTGGSVSQTDFDLLVQQVATLRARQNYANDYLKMIDEAIAVEGFDGWQPPE